MQWNWIFLVIDGSRERPLHYCRGGQLADCLTVPLAAFLLTPSSGRYGNSRQLHRYNFHHMKVFYWFIKLASSKWVISCNFYLKLYSFKPVIPVHVWVSLSERGDSLLWDNFIKNYNSNILADWRDFLFLYIDQSFSLWNRFQKACSIMALTRCHTVKCGWQNGSHWLV